MRGRHSDIHIFTGGVDIGRSSRNRLAVAPLQAQDIAVYNAIHWFGEAEFSASNSIAKFCPVGYPLLQASICRGSLELTGSNQERREGNVAGLRIDSKGVAFISCKQAERTAQMCCPLRLGHDEHIGAWCYSGSLSAGATVVSTTKAAVNETSKTPEKRTACGRHFFCWQGFPD